MIIVAKPLVADSARLKSAYVKKFNFYVNLASLSSKPFFHTNFQPLSPAIPPPLALNAPLPFQNPLLLQLQHALPLPVLLRQLLAGTFNIALDLRTPVLTAPLPRRL